MSGDQGHSLYWRLAQQARPYWLHLSGVFLLSLLSSPFALLAPMATSHAQRSGVNHETDSSVGAPAIALVARVISWLYVWKYHGLAS